MIAVKDRKSVSFLKLEPFIPTGSTNVFLLFEPFIVSFFVQHVGTEAVTFHSIVYSLRASASFILIDFKIANDLPIFAYYYAFVIVSLT